MTSPNEAAVPTGTSQLLALNELHNVDLVLYIQAGSPTRHLLPLIWEVRGDSSKVAGITIVFNRLFT